MKEPRSVSMGGKLKERGLPRPAAGGFPSPPESSSSRNIDWWAAWFMFRERWWVILLCLLLTVGPALYYLFTTPPTYTATCTVQVDEQDPRIVNVRNVVSENYTTAEGLKTVEQAFGSRTLLRRVIKANRLMLDPSYGQEDFGPYISEGRLIELLYSRTDASLRKGTRLIDLNIDDTNPARAQQLANSLAQEYVTQQLEQRGKITGSANEFLIREEKRLRQKLETSEQALQAYREKSGAVSLEDRQNIVADKLKDLNRNVTQAKSARIRLEADYQAVHQAAGQPYQQLLTIPSVAALPEVAALQGSINAKESEFATVRERYLPLHPKYLQAEGQLKELRSALERAVSKASDSLKKQFESSLENEARLTAALREQEQAALELSKISIPYNALVRDQEADKTVYQSVLARLKETNVAEAAGNTNVRVIEYAFMPKFPTKPRTFRILALCIFAGLVVGGVLVFLLDAFDTSIRSVDQAEETLGMPSLAVVPESKFGKLDECLLLQQNPATPEAEAIRSLRTSLVLIEAAAGQKVTLFTSAVPSEGKSFVAANYAAALAEQGSRTLLIDADLRRPGLGFIFAKAKGSKGLSNYLSGDDSFESVRHSLGIKNLFIMPAGTRAANPAELFASGKFAALLETAGMEFDAVVVDSAPVNVVSDTLMLVRDVPVVVMVVRSRRTPSRTLLRARRLLQMADCSPVGFVLNRVPRGPSFNYYSYYEGEYSSGGVYGTPEKPAKGRST